MTKPMKIDFVSDVSCPWCVIGLGALEAALGRVSDLVAADIHFQPFELNPDMPPGGQNVGEHIFEKYGRTPEQSVETRDMIRARAAEFGFTMATGPDSRIYNTFDAHRLLHWAGVNARPEGRQGALKRALFEAYFTKGRDPGDLETLVEAAASVGLDAGEARKVLTGEWYADEVRAAEQMYREAGINAVPAIIINDRYLISGGQPVDTFERALRTIAAEA